MAAICDETDVCVYRRCVYFGGGSKRRRGAIGRRRMLGNPADYAEFIPLPLFLSLSLLHTPSYTLSLDKERVAIRDTALRSRSSASTLYLSKKRR